MDALKFDLAYRPPFDWTALCLFLGRRAIGGVETVDGDTYYRALRLDYQGATYAGWISATPSPTEPVLTLWISASLAPALQSVLKRAKHVFDLSCDPETVAAVLGDLATRHPGLRLPGAWDGFELLARAILGQQVTVQAARTFATRLAQIFGEPLAGAPTGLTVTFPSATRMTEVRPEEIQALGVVGSRARALVGAAQAIASKEIVLEPGSDPKRTLVALRRLHGVGDWTAQYVAMRALSWPDAFPATDHGVLRAMDEKDPRRARARAASWAPWRSYAVMHLWQMLEGRCKKERMRMTVYSYIDSPLGRVLLTSDGDSLTGLHLEGQKHEPQPDNDWTRDDALLLFAATATQLAEYFAGTRSSFDLPVAPMGTPFQQEVWRLLQEIPYGARISYGDIAREMGRPQAARAVGAAVGRNPVSIIVPCHRVVGSDGSLTGYAGGLERKTTLLELERRHTQAGSPQTDPPQTGS
ncbi:MAG: methylated-DNA--[protein]-cysteine S-methyltransferase [Actinobacteria bacterium]|nr:methylated-DNA--[protein]-cysteine S-methyltransferase [Actinomycetota bacterium]